MGPTCHVTSCFKFRDSEEGLVIDSGEQEKGIQAQMATTLKNSLHTCEQNPKASLKQLISIELYLCSLNDGFSFADVKNIFPIVLLPSPLAC